MVHGVRLTREAKMQKWIFIFTRNDSNLLEEMIAILGVKNDFVIFYDDYYKLFEYVLLFPLHMLVT